MSQLSCLRTESAYKQFLSENKRNIWVKENEKIAQASVPLYTEMALIDKAGNEVIKISNGNAVPKAKLTNVSNSKNTGYKSEEYFAKAKGLSKGEVYVSPVTGWYVSRPEFRERKEVCRHSEACSSRLLPGGVSGVLTLALDYRHLAGFTDHIIPTQQRLCVRSGRLNRKLCLHSAIREDSSSRIQMISI